MWGVTERVARSWGYTGSMRDLPRSVAKEIYQALYWSKVRAEEMPEAVRFDVFDTAVNSGVAQSIKLLQRAAGVKDDGVIGPKTLSAVRGMDPQLLDKRFSGHRLRFMTTLKNWPPFSRGWASRIATNLIED
jgi:lysozyme family protein